MDISKFSEDELKLMQTQAIKRAKEMRKRAILPEEPPKKEESKIKFNHTNKRFKTKKTAPNLNKNTDNNSKNFVNNIFKMLEKDTEKILLIMLILLLSEENADIGTILALIYLIN